ncbi:hypothetical protein R5R35_003542 [Gryllus longicercus]|uniref:Uncharacterized protein n=1 Tax=Gryllus longicercus TaxID=2509291 RepID=A0AAN9VT24_9ORTH
MQQRCAGAVVAAALAAAAALMAAHVVPAAASSSSSASSSANAAAGLDLVYGTYQQCEGQADALGCLKLQAIKVMHRALSQDSLPITEGLTLVRSEGTGEAAGSGAPMGDEESLARALPADAGRRQARLDELLADHVARLLRSRAVSLSVPRLLAGLLPAEEGEGARKEGGGGGGGGGGIGSKGGKKGHGALLLAMLMKGGMIAYAYKALAVLAGKALLVAKVALVLASVLGLSHLVGHGHKGGTTYEIVKHPVVSHGYSHSQAVLPADDHHHFDVTAVGHGGGHGGGFGGNVGGGHGGGQLYGGHGWGRAGVGRSLGDLAAASPAPASQLVAPESAEQTASVAETGGRSPEA